MGCTFRAPSALPPRPSLSIQEAYQLLLTEDMTFLQYQVSATHKNLQAPGRLSVVKPTCQCRDS